MSVGTGTSTALTPLNRNFGGLKRFVADYVQGADDEDILDLAARGINAGVNELNLRTWNWSLKNENLTLTADTATYTISTDFKKPRKLWKLNSDSERKGWINWLDPKVFMDERPRATESGTPQWYTVINPVNSLQIELDVPASSAFVTNVPTLQFHYYARVQEFADDGDTINDIGAPPEVWLFLGWYGRWDLAMVREASVSVVDRAFAKYKEIWNALIRDDRNTLTDWEVYY